MDSILNRFKKAAENSAASYGLLLFVSLVLAMLTFDSFLHTNGDNAIYVILGESIAEGNGYRNMHGTAESFHSQYPPVFPFLIAVTNWLSPGNFADYKIMVTVFYIASVLACYWAFSTVSKVTGLILALLVAVNFEIVSFGHWIMSEVPSMFFALMTFGFLQRLDQSKLKHLILAAVFCSLGLLTRSALIFLVPSGLLFLWIQKKWKDGAVFGLVSITPVFIWSAVKNAHGSAGGGYAAKILQMNPYRPELGTMSLGDLISRMVENFTIYTNSIIPSMLFPSVYTNETIAMIRNGQGSLFLSVISIAIIICFIAGLVQGIRKNEWLTVSIIFCAVGILLLWPSVWTTQRFVIPIMPFLLLISFYGFSLLNSWRYADWLKTAVVALVVISSLSRMEAGRKEYPAQFAQYKAASQWVGRNSKTGDVIACRKGEFTYLFSDRKCIRYKYSLNPEEIINQFIKYNVKYVIVDQLGFSSTPRYLVPAIQENPAFFNLVYVTPKPENYVFGFRHENE